MSTSVAGTTSDVQTPPRSALFNDGSVSTDLQSPAYTNDSSFFGDQSSLPTPGSSTFSLKSPGIEGRYPPLATKRPHRPLEIITRECKARWEREIRSLGRARTRRVAVLLVAWDEVHREDLKTTREIRALAKVFETKYHFRVYTTLLSCVQQSPPQHQLQAAIVKFTHTHNKEGTLCIVYYGGHGIASADNEDLILATEGARSLPKRDPSMNQIRWSTIEPLLQNLSADLLLIIDCCHAGIVGRSKRSWPNARAHFEFIGSTPFFASTSGPLSSGSFTRALIQALDELAETELIFNTVSLIRKIESIELFRRAPKQQILHSECGKNNKFKRLKLTPLPQGQMDLQSPIEPPQVVSPYQFYLHLKVVYTQEPRPDDITALMDHLNNMIIDDQVPVTDVLWADLTERNITSHMAAAAGQIYTALFRKSKNKLAFLRRFGSLNADPIPSPGLRRAWTTLAGEKDNNRLTKTISRPREIEFADLRSWSTAHSEGPRVRVERKSISDTSNSILSRPYSPGLLTKQKTMPDITSQSVGIPTPAAAGRQQSGRHLFLVFSCAIALLAMMSYMIILRLDYLSPAVTSCLKLVSSALRHRPRLHVTWHKT